MRVIDKLKKWQVEAFQQGRSAQHSLCQAPGGSGKSLLQVMMAQADIEDTGNKQLILVPKNHIHHGFFDSDCIAIVLPGQTTVSRWVVTHNFCSTKKNDAKTKMLKAFLLADVRDLRQTGELTAIATHKAMVSAWSSMRSSERKQALRNISFRIDEAHHISNVFHTNDLDLFNVKDREAILADATQLGRIVQYILRHSNETVKLHLATATFFRGDRRTILSKHFKNSFAHYYLPWDEHFSTLGIDNLQFDYINYDDDPIPLLLKVVASQPCENHLVIIPALTHRYRTKETLDHIMRGLRKLFRKDQVLDLVTRSTQEAHKQLLHAHSEQFRVVVACRLFDEGTDWVPCTRMHNTDACEQSVTLAVQRFFRPLRQHPRKNDVRIYNYLPNFSSEMTEEEKRGVLSNRFNAFLAAIVTTGELMPCLVAIKGQRAGEKKTKLSLQEIYGKDYSLVMSDLLRGYELVADKTDSEQMEAVVETVLSTYGSSDEVEDSDLRNALLSQLIRIGSPKSQKIDRKTLEPEGIDAESIRVQGFDKVWEKMAPVPSVVCYGTDNIDMVTVRQLMDIVRKPPSLEDIHDSIRKFYERTGDRPTFHQSQWMDAIDRSARAVDKVLRRHYATTLAKEVRIVLGDANDDLLARTHELVREYWAKGIRIGNKFGDLPEIGMTSFALNGRLTWNYGTTLAKEVEKILGPQAKPLTLPKTRQVIREYQKKGVRLHRKFGHIPELDMSSFNLADRLQRNFSVTLKELVDEVANGNADQHGGGPRRRAANVTNRAAGDV
jgi:hypothetical protein